MASEIRISTFPSLSPLYTSFQKTVEEIVPVTFFGPFDDVSMITEKGKAVGLLTVHRRGQKAICHYWFTEESNEETVWHVVSFATQYIDTRYRCDLIHVNQFPREYKKVFLSCLYFPKGRNLQRIREPWRKQLVSSVFDEEGYIINQGKMNDIPFGWFSTKDKGCGWIAVWNLLKMNKQEQFMQETAHDLDRYALTGEILGESIFKMYFYLRSKHLDVHLFSGTEEMIVKRMQNSKCGILLYNHKKGAHYVCYRMLEGGSARFYNAVYGHYDYLMRPQDFEKKHQWIPVGSLVYIR